MEAFSSGILPARQLRQADGSKEQAITISGVDFVAHAAGALYWPEEGLLAVADLHLEKGSALAKRGVLLPPYDTPTTLARLAEVVDRFQPRLVIALGDNFHDRGGADRMSDVSREALVAIQRGRDWVWIMGNHDPDPLDGVGGHFAESIAMGRLNFRHAPSSPGAWGEITGHLHPIARVARRGHVVSCRCFASSAARLIMPAFGAYAGGLNIRDQAIVSLFSDLPFTAHMLGATRIYAVAATRCRAD